MERVKQTMHKNAIAVLVLVIVSLAVIGVGAWRYIVVSDKLEATRTELANTRATVSNLEKQLERSEQDKNKLREQLTAKEQQVNNLQGEFNDLREEVGLIKKRQETDEELLKKYSKVFFLNEHYRPGELTEIDTDWRIPADDDEYIHPKVWPELENLLEDAADDGVDLRIISAFRSFDQQKELKSHYNVVYGEGTANQFSAPQGYSEHQLGTTVDFTTEELGTSFSALNETEAYEWLQENAHKYGFVLSYPEDNSYYQFEPWHWRFVGVELATDLHEDGQNFYDMPQREINEYLVELFED